MFATNPVISLGPFQCVFALAMVAGFVWLAWMLGLDEGKARGIRLGRAIERQLRDEAVDHMAREEWFPARRHR